MQHADLGPVENAGDLAVPGESAGNDELDSAKIIISHILIREIPLHWRIKTAYEGNLNYAAMGVSAKEQVNIPVLVCFAKD